MNGVLVVDKPAGPTSHDVVMRVRRALGTREVGHAGTLDPMATGVLVVALGEATKLLAWLTDQSKVYEATIRLGVETDTLDALGRETRRVEPSSELIEVLARSPAGGIHPYLQAALDAERARTSQIPPAYSAIQQQGVRAYKRARRGEPVQLPSREVEVRTLSFVACTAESAGGLNPRRSRQGVLRALARPGPGGGARDGRPSDGPAPHSLRLLRD